MKTIKYIPFLLLGVGTLGLLVTEFTALESRCLVLTFAAMNILGFALLLALHKRLKI